MYSCTSLATVLNSTSDSKLPGSPTLTWLRVQELTSSGRQQPRCMLLARAIDLQEQDAVAGLIAKGKDGCLTRPERTRVLLLPRSAEGRGRLAAAGCVMTSTRVPIAPQSWCQEKAIGSFVALRSALL